MSFDIGCMSNGGSEATVLYNPINLSREMYCDIWVNLIFNCNFHLMVRILVSLKDPLIACAIFLKVFDTVSKHNIFSSMSHWISDGFCCFPGGIFILMSNLGKIFKAFPR